MQQVLASVAEQDEGIPMAMELMKRCNAELFAERASAERTEQELKNELRGDHRVGVYRPVQSAKGTGSISRPV